MEVLKLRDTITGVSIVLVAGSIGWIVTTLIEVDKRTAVTAVKVEENHKMIHTLWIDFVRRKTDGNLAGSISKQITNSPWKRKWSDKRKRKNQLQTT